MILNRYTPATQRNAYGNAATSGPSVYVDQYDVVAVEQSHYETNDGQWRSLLHLRQGGTLLVDDRWEYVVEELKKERALSALAR